MKAYVMLWLSNNLDRLSERVFLGAFKEFPRNIALKVELARARSSYELGKKKSSSELGIWRCSNKLSK